LWNYDHRPERVRVALERALSELGMTYVEQWLMHWPVGFPFKGQGTYFPKNQEGHIEVRKMLDVHVW
jgi:diketogulonate reductase-like aldo/keto reductase